MEKTLQVTFELANELHEPLLAELSAYDFNAFEEDEHQLKAFGPGEDWMSEGRAEVYEWLRQRGITDDVISEHWIHPRNWNEEWARTVEPIRVDFFLVKPTWHSVPEDFEGWVIEVDPKMTFGTGHHESTRLVLRLMPDWISEGDRILDAGSGTGILAVAAVRCGASRVIAFDNHPSAREHALEVFEQNQVGDRIDYRTGEIEVVPETDFAGILANINRNVLIDLMPAFAARLRPDGFLILSGLLAESRPSIEEALAANDLEIVEEIAENEWYALVTSPSATG